MYADLKIEKKDKDSKPNKKFPDITSREKKKERG